jgi:hypothetical protein
VPRKHGYFTRPRAEWIAVKVPAIVSQELFDRVQLRLEQNAKRERQPDTHYLLSGLLLEMTERNLRRLAQTVRRAPTKHNAATIGRKCSARLRFRSSASSALRQTMSRSPG